MSLVPVGSATSYEPQWSRAWAGQRSIGTKTTKGLLLMPTPEMQRRLNRGARARLDYDAEAQRKARERREGVEVQAFAEAHFPVEKQSQAIVALWRLRWIHGKGNVTLGMVRERMRRMDERFGVCNDNERSTA